MGTLKSSTKSEIKIENSHVVDLRSGMEDMVNNPLLAEAYNISKTYIRFFQKMRKISSEKSCSAERAFHFDKNVTYFQNSKIKDLSTILTEFETMCSHILQKNLKSNDRNQLSSLQDRTVSNSVEDILTIESLDSKEKISSKEGHSVKARRGLRERQKNLVVQNVPNPSFIKKPSSSLPFLAPKAEIKGRPSNKSNFQRGKTENFVDEVPSAKSSIVDNICPSHKKRKYKVKVKVRRKKLKREASPPPPPPPKLPPPPPPPPKLPPPLPSLQKLPQQSQSEFNPLPSHPRSLPPLKPTPTISTPFCLSRLPIPDHPFGNSKSRNITSLPTYASEIQTLILNRQLQQTVQTSQYTVDQLHYLQSTGHTSCAIHNNSPSHFTSPHTGLFYPNYCPTVNNQMYIGQHYPAPAYTNHLN